MKPQKSLHDLRLGDIKMLGGYISQKNKRASSWLQSSARESQQNQLVRVFKKSL